MESSKRARGAGRALLHLVDSLAASCRVRICKKYIVVPSFLVLLPPFLFWCHDNS